MGGERRGEGEGAERGCKRDGGEEEAEGGQRGQQKGGTGGTGDNGDTGVSEWSPMTYTHT